MASESDKKGKRVQIGVWLGTSYKDIAIKKYLVSAHDGDSEKELVMKAIGAFYLPAALVHHESSIKEVNTIDSVVAKAVVDSVWVLMGQILAVRRTVDRSSAAGEVIDGVIGSMLPAFCKEFGIAIPETSKGQPPEEPMKISSQSTYTNNDISFKS
jgi:hypothetical protein